MQKEHYKEEMKEYYDTPQSRRQTPNPSSPKKKTTNIMGKRKKETIGKKTVV